jgi:hypothetical protein
VTPAELLTIEQRLSIERFRPYRTATGDDPVQAIQLYERNTDLSAAFWAVLCDVEVLLRNAMHERLTAWSLGRYGQLNWYLDPGRVLSQQAVATIGEARQHEAANGRPETAGRVVAELPLGFWRFLLSSRYERTLWLPCLRSAFPGVQGRGMRRDVHDAVRELHMLRNRIAHHEPIHNRPLTVLHTLALTTAGWICPTTEQWISARSRVPDLLTAMRVTPDRARGIDTRAAGGKPTNRA